MHSIRKLNRSPSHYFPWPHKKSRQISQTSTCVESPDNEQDQGARKYNGLLDLHDLHFDLRDHKWQMYMINDKTESNSTL